MTGNVCVLIDLVFSSESADKLREAMSVLASIHAEHPDDERFTRIAKLVADVIYATDSAES
jgi:hypothetical protein